MKKIGIYSLGLISLITAVFILSTHKVSAIKGGDVCTSPDGKAGHWNLAQGCIPDPGSLGRPCTVPITNQPGHLMGLGNCVADPVTPTTTGAISACLKFAPEAYSIVSDYGPGKITKTTIGTFENANPPSILNNIPFILDKNCINAGKFGKIQYLGTGSKEIEIKNSNIFLNSNNQYNFFTPYDSVKDSLVNENDLISSVDKNKKLIFEFGKSTDPNKVTAEFPSTNCVKISGNGPNRIVFLRGKTGPSSVSELMQKANEIISKGFKTTDPYAKYMDQFSFYLDLNKFDDQTLKINPYEKFFDESAGKVIQSASSCGSGAFTYFMMLNNPGITVAYASFYSDKAPVVFLNMPQITSDLFPRISIHEMSHSIANLDDQYIGIARGTDDEERTIRGTNCSVEPAKAFRSSIDGKLYGHTDLKGCTHLWQIVNNEKIFYYRPSDKSLMSSNHPLPDVITCGFIIAGIKIKENPEGPIKANAEKYWPECLTLNIVKDGIPAPEPIPVPVLSATPQGLEDIKISFSWVGSKLYPSAKFNLVQVVGIEDPTKEPGMRGNDISVIKSGMSMTETEFIIRKLSVNKNYCYVVRVNDGNNENLSESNQSCSRIVGNGMKMSFKAPVPPFKFGSIYLLKGITNLSIDTGTSITKNNIKTIEVLIDNKPSTINLSASYENGSIWGVNLDTKKLKNGIYNISARVSTNNGEIYDTNKISFVIENPILTIPTIELWTAPTTAKLCSVLSYTLNFKGGPTELNYKGFAHFVDKDGVMKFRSDIELPIATTQWTGDLVNIPVSVSVPSNISPGQYKVMAGLYSGNKAATLTQGTGVVNKDNLNRYEVGSITINTGNSETPTIYSWNGPTNAKVGDTISYNLHFKGGPTDTDKKVFVHFIDKDGNKKFQSDITPQPATTMWCGESISISTSVAIPSTITPGVYKVIAGIYSGNTAIPLNAGSGVPKDGINRYQVGTINITSKLTAYLENIPSDYSLALLYKVFMMMVK